MGKLGPRLDSRKKAKRWPKGQSSSSNPQTKKHREQASRLFLINTPGTPGLTKKALKRHNAMLSLAPDLEKLDLSDDRAEGSVDGTADTTDTFATDYSNCSNVSFSRFLTHFQSNSLLHKEMLAVLSAVAEVIKQNGGTESSTEYFAALMSTLEAVESETSVAATLSLLAMGMKTVPKNILNVQFSAASEIILQILTKYATTDDFLILRHSVHCLAVLLRVQELAAWSNSSTMEVLDAVLSFVTHAKPKVRKAAQHGICAILRGSSTVSTEEPIQHHPAAPQIAKHCMAQLQIGAGAGGVTTILHILTLLKDILHLLPKPHVKSICESFLKLMGMKNVLLTSCCLQAFHGLFVARPSENVLPAQRNGQIITALYDYQPPASDSQPTVAWLTVMQEAHINLAKTSLNLCAAVLPKMLEKCMELWLSDRSEVIAAASHSMKALLEDCLGVMCETEESIQKYNVAINQVLLLTLRALSYQYLEAWHYLLHLIALLFRVTKKTKNPRLLDILKSLADLHDSHNFSFKNDVQYAIGAAIMHMGPELVLQTIPLKSGDTILMKRCWLLPLLKTSIQQSSISFFVNTLLPLAAIAEKKANESTIAGKSFAFLVPQIWSILPSICQDATDVKENFKNIAKILGVTLNEKKELRMSVLTALRRLIAKAVDKDDKEEIAELGKFAKNYLPILLNLYTIKPTGSDEAGHHNAAFETFRVYLKITNQTLINELFDRAFDRLQDPANDQQFKESVYDVLRLLMEFTDMQRLKILYDMCIPSVKDATKMKEQKKAYRFLEELCGSETEICKQFMQQHRREIQKLLTSTASSAHKPCKGARLKCLIHLVKIHPRLEKTKFLTAIIPEAILCIKDLNSKCRAAAYTLLNAIADKFLDNPDYLREYVNMVVSGLLGTPQFCSASLLGLASVTYHYNGSLGVQTIKHILQNACTLARSKTREIVEAALSYIKVYISVIPSPIVATSLEDIVETLSSMEKDCELHFRRKVRDILVKLVRKYGLQTISDLVPANDTILQKRLKNIRKAEEAKKKKKQPNVPEDSEKELEEEFNMAKVPKSIEEILAESEAESDDEENAPKKNRKRISRKEAWIQENEENIVDLADPKAAQNITITQPGRQTPKAVSKKSKESEFKTAPDGRLIIVDDGQKHDDDDADGAVQKKKRKAPFLHSDSEDDYEEDDAFSVATSNAVGEKRKHSGNSDTMSLNSQATSRYKAGGSGIHRPVKKARIEKTPGAEYRAAKAGGDIKKKGKPEPYAYLPLTRAALNKRKRKQDVTKMHKFLKAAKKSVNSTRNTKKK